MAERPFTLEVKGQEAALDWLEAWIPPPKVKVEMLKSVRRVMNKNIGLQFVKLRRGGTARGVSWRPFANQYQRMFDGQTVTAAGGVPRVRPAWKPKGVKRGKTTGSVLGRKRPSGRRVTRSSNLMQDTGAMRAQRASINFLSPAVIRFGATVPYAARQNQLRPWAFFEVPKDIDESDKAAFKTFVDLMRRVP